MPPSSCRHSEAFGDGGADARGDRRLVAPGVDQHAALRLTRDDLVEAGAQALVKGDVHALVAVLGMTAPLRARQALGDRQVEPQREVRPEGADRSEEHTSELQSLMR